MHLLRQMSGRCLTTRVPVEPVPLPPGFRGREFTRFQWLALRDCVWIPFNDPNEILVHAGAEGYVKHIGDWLQVIRIYEVHFINEGDTYGCREAELEAIDDVENEIEVITYESYQGSLQDVSLGRIDAVLNDNEPVVSGSDGLRALKVAEMIVEEIERSLKN